MRTGHEASCAPGAALKHARGSPPDGETRSRQDGRDVASKRDWGGVGETCGVSVAWGSRSRLDDAWLTSGIGDTNGASRAKTHPAAPHE
jgi:hypothetical protein